MANSTTAASADLFNSRLKGEKGKVSKLIRMIVMNLPKGKLTMSKMKSYTF